ncbi:hypothetical protein ACGFYP_22620 [Streptomyces sp. NPDC048370]|uniref:hypothetical protein n=1 Tax=Streptomyces sp. NPDC048370 TaxID=3365540 RepID=UPI00371994A7
MRVRVTAAGRDVPLQPAMNLGRQAPYVALREQQPGLALPEAGEKPGSGLQLLGEFGHFRCRRRGCGAGFPTGCAWALDQVDGVRVLTTVNFSS